MCIYISENIYTLFRPEPHTTARTVDFRLTSLRIIRQVFEQIFCVIGILILPFLSIYVNFEFYAISRTSRGKLVLALVLSVMMILTSVAFAAAPTTGTITITNSADGTVTASERTFKKQRELRRTIGREEKLELRGYCNIKDPTPYEEVKNMIRQQKKAVAT